MSRLRLKAYYSVFENNGILDNNKIPNNNKSARVLVPISKWNKIPLFIFLLSIRKMLFLYIYRIHTCSAPLIAINNINTACEYVTIWHYVGT